MIASDRQYWGDLHVAVDIVWPAVEQHHSRATGGTKLGVADIQLPGLDLLHGVKNRVWINPAVRIPVDIQLSPW